MHPAHRAGRLPLLARMTRRRQALNTSPRSPWRVTAKQFSSLTVVMGVAGRWLSWTAARTPPAQLGTPAAPQSPSGCRGFPRVSWRLTSPAWPQPGISLGSSLLPGRVRRVSRGHDLSTAICSGYIRPENGKARRPLSPPSRGTAPPAVHGHALITGGLMRHVPGQIQNSQAGTRSHDCY
jgi:hypothetical protein